MGSYQEPQPRLNHGRTDHEKRLALINGLIEAAEYIARNAEVPIPPHVVLSIPTLARSDEAKHAAVDYIARQYGVHACTQDNGCYIAARHFGAVTIEAHFTPAATQVENQRHLTHGIKDAAA